MTLDILIPTYNRAVYLKKNLEILCGIVSRIKNATINVIISDNDSSDNTRDIVEAIICRSDINGIKYYRNDTNIGIRDNLIHIVSLSQADYIMYLGDDDYINYEYLSNAISYLNKDKEIACIFGSYEAISEKGDKLGYGRDLGLCTKIFEAGVENVKLNLQRGSQIAGLILKRVGLYEALKDKNISNLYPHLFMMGYNCLRGRAVHIPEWPLLITSTDKRDWDFDNTGLLVDIFENVKSLDLSDGERFVIEKGLIEQQPWRYLSFSRNGVRRFRRNLIKQMRIILKISFSKNTSKKGHFLFPFILTYIWCKHLIIDSLIKVRDKLKTK